jgi:hypothetical protein
MRLSQDHGITNDTLELYGECDTTGKIQLHHKHE